MSDGPDISSSSSSLSDPVPTLDTTTINYPQRRDWQVMTSELLTCFAGFHINTEGNMSKGVSGESDPHLPVSVTEQHSTWIISVLRLDPIHQPSITRNSYSPSKPPATIRETTSTNKTTTSMGISAKSPGPRQQFPTRRRSAEGAECLSIWTSASCGRENPGLSWHV